MENEGEALDAKMSIALLLFKAIRSRIAGERGGVSDSLELAEAVWGATGGAGFGGGEELGG